MKAAIEAFRAMQDSLPTLTRKALHGLIKQMRIVASENRRDRKADFSLASE
ncbi:hypothetical protein [Sinorhizobium chiapasense]|uniref:Transposase n=1 Tax=Sinorhizobium chiapasense TaxID=501572 RepID=A0ABZ2BG23_9HYPH